MHSTVVLCIRGFLHINSECVCEVGQRPGSLGTDIWKSIIKGSEDSVCCVGHEHHILK